ncbi:MAG: ATP-binding protein [Sedimenticola sp.]|nr:ATP-binding protein [Sedimenticola sp.]
MLKLIDPALPRNPEFQSALVRLAIWLFAVLYIGFGALTDYYVVDYQDYKLLFGGFLVVFLLLLASVLWRPVWQGRRFVSLLLDISATSLCIYLTDDVVSPFYLLYIWIFISYGTRYGKGHLVAASLLSILAYGVLSTVLDQWSRYTFEVIFFLLLLIMLPLYQYTLLRKLHQARLEAERSDRAKSIFLSSMTHELRTPLSGIMGMSRLLLNSSLDREQREYTESIASSAGVLDALIGEVLDLSRMDAGGLEIRSHCFDIRALCRDVMTTLSHKALDKGLELICCVDPQVPVELCYDELRLRQILFNLLTNALKFTRRGEVELSLAVDMDGPEAVSGWLLIEVRDSGIGLDPDEQERLFERFWQADASATGEQGGIGLGCTITRRLTELMGGQISVQSEKHVGSTFRIRLPLESRPCPLPGVAKGSSRGRSALVFEGNARMQSLIRDICGRQGVDCHGIGRIREMAQEIDRIAQRGGVDFAILADSPAGLDMSRLGILLRTHLDPQLPIIYLGYRERRFSDNHPASRFLVKPCIGDELSRQIDRLLELDLPGPDAEQEVRGGCSRLPGFRVLMAEDNAINGKVLRTLLEGMGCQVTWARDGAAALREAAVAAFDIAFIDLRMPKKNGLEFARELRSREKGGVRLPVIALTANTSQHTRQQCMEAGMDDFLAKPVQERQLFSVINRLTGTSSVAG